MILKSVLFVSLSIRVAVSPEVIRNLDEKTRLDLQLLDDKFFFWVAASAIVVAIGCAMEGPELFHELWPKRFPCFSGRWVKRVGLIGWFVVVLGVAAEGVFEIFDHRASGLLQTFDEELLTDAAKEAGDAATSAKTAHGEADAVKTMAGNLRIELSNTTIELRAKAAKLNDQLADSEYWSVISSIHRKRYTDTQLKLDTGREVPERLMTSVLNRYPAGEATILCRYDGKGETFQTARGISHALWAAHWKINSLKPPCLGPNGEHPLDDRNLPALPEMNNGEILIIGNAKSLNQPLGSKSSITGLENALLTLDGGIGNERNESLPDNTFIIVVGPKLPTPF